MTPGAMLPYAVALLLLLIGGKDNYGAEHMAATSFDFRLLLGLGAGEVGSECVECV
jgi:hypothetical protein